MKATATVRPQRVIFPPKTRASPSLTHPSTRYMLNEIRSRWSMHHSIVSAGPDISNIHASSAFNFCTLSANTSSQPQQPPTRTVDVPLITSHIHPPPTRISLPPRCQPPFRSSQFQSPSTPDLPAPSPSPRLGASANACDMRHDEARPRKRRRPPTRRKTVRWSAREVEALLAGVRHHGVGKWAAILRHSKVFNGVRTSVDLKDKWRNLTSPVRAAALSGRPIPDPPQTHARSTGDDLQDEMRAQHLSPPCSPAHSPSPPPVATAPPQSPQHSASDVQSSSQLHDHDANQLLCQSPCQSQANSQVHNQSLADPQSPPDPSPQDVDIAAKVTPASNVVPQVKNVPPPPSESSVSPEVLSTPATHATPQVTPLVAPQPDNHAPLQPHVAQQPGLLPNASYPFPSPNNPHVAAMQQVMGQSLYQSAAAIAAYYRRIGIEPTPYSIAAALTANPAAGLMNSFCPTATSPAAPFQGDDDDDDDDDDEPVMPQLPLPFTPVFNKDAVHMPYNPAFPQPFQPPLVHDSPVLPVDPAQVGPGAAGVPGNADLGTKSTPNLRETKNNSPTLMPVEQKGDEDRVDEGRVDQDRVEDGTEDRDEDGTEDRVEEEVPRAKNADEESSQGPKSEELPLSSDVNVDEEGAMDDMAAENTPHLDYFNVEEFPTKNEEELEQDEDNNDHQEELSRSALEEATLEMGAEGDDTLR